MGGRLLSAGRHISLYSLSILFISLYSLSIPPFSAACTKEAAGIGHGSRLLICGAVQTEMSGIEPTGICCPKVHIMFYTHVHGLMF